MNSIAQHLRAELRAAHTIIGNALALMTLDQKRKWGCANERDSVEGEGVTRAHERQAVIDNGSALALFLELRRADQIIDNAWDIQSFHQHALWSIANQQDGVAATHPTRADSRSAVLTAAMDAPRELVGDARGEIADSIVEFVRNLGRATNAPSAPCYGAEGTRERSVLTCPTAVHFSESDIAAIRRAIQGTPQRFTVLEPDESAASLTAAERDVFAERRRQVDVEGHTAKGDDENREGAMSSAAASYALIASGWSQRAALEFWPTGWSLRWWKPTERRRNLVKAAALLIAEIECIDRQAAKTNHKPRIPKTQPTVRG